MAESKPVLFVHIPKTGGTSLWDALRYSYGHRRVLRIMEHDTEANIDRLNHMVQDGDALNYRLLGGHVFFDPTRPFPYMTMLREPVSRIISGYYHALRVPTHRLYKQFNEEKIDVQTGLTLLAPNLHVRYLAPVPLDRKPVDEDLQKAKYNLEHHIEGIGLLEDFHKSLILFRQLFGGRMPYYRRLNVGTNKQRQHAQEVLDLAREVNRLDIELYDFATELFHQRQARYRVQITSTLWFFNMTLPYWQRRQLPKEA